MATRDEILAAIGTNPLLSDEDVRSLFLRAEPGLLNDPQFLADAASKDSRALYHGASGKVREDAVIELSRRGDPIDPRCFGYVKSRESVLEVVSINGAALKWVDPKFWADRDVVLASVKNAGHTLVHASEDLKRDREVALAAVRNDWSAMALIDSTLKDDREFVMAAVKKDGRAFQYASNGLRSDRNSVMEAVRESGVALRFVTEELRADRDLVLAAVGNCGEVLEAASTALRSDIDVVRAAVWNNPGALRHAASHLRTNSTILENARESRSSSSHNQGTEVTMAEATRSHRATAPAPSLQESSERTVTITEKRKLEFEQDSKDAKRYKTVMSSLAEEYLCPITTELPVDPVTAEDGQVYERSAIEEHIRRQGDNLTSPITREPMGPRLTPSVQARNSIKSLVENGAVGEEVAKQWKMQWKQKVKVEETRKKADGGDTEAMCKLGDWYYNGENGLAKDLEMSYQWSKKASDLHSVHGMAIAGNMLVNGNGIEKNVTHGVGLTFRAAGMGSDLAAFNIGVWYEEGCDGLPKDTSQAKYWYRKAVDGSCRFKHASESTRNDAAEYLRYLEGN